MIKAVVFDVGETLIDETRIWSRWADRLGVPRFAMLGLLGGMAAMDRPHGDATTRQSMRRWGGRLARASRVDRRVLELLGDSKLLWTEIADCEIDAARSGRRKLPTCGGNAETLRTTELL